MMASAAQVVAPRAADLMYLPTLVATLAQTERPSEEEGAQTMMETMATIPYSDEVRMMPETIPYSAASTMGPMSTNSGPSASPLRTGTA